MNPTHLLTLLIACSIALFHSNPAEATDTPKRIVFLGDSLTAGYGIDPADAYPALISQKLASNGYDGYLVQPAGLSGETSAGGLRRVNWILQKKADILVLALGANDGLRGIDVSDTKSNLQGIIDSAKQKYPEIKIMIAGMQMPPNLGPDYTAKFKDMYPSLADKNGAALLPFLLEDVGGKPELNIADGIHPNPEGHKIMAENIWKILEPLLSQ